MRKKLLGLMAVCVMIAAFTGCTAKSTTYDIEELHDTISSEGAFSDVLSPITPEIAQALYGYDVADVANCAVSCSTGATTEEIAIFECADEDAASRVFEVAKNRVQTQKTAYESYAPLEIPKLDDAVVNKTGNYVIYIVSNDSAKINELLA